VPYSPYPRLLCHHRIALETKLTTPLTSTRGDKHIAGVEIAQQYNQHVIIAAHRTGGQACSTAVRCACRRPPLHMHARFALCLTVIRPICIHLINPWPHSEAM